MTSPFENPFNVWLLLTAALVTAWYLSDRKELRTRGMVYGGFLILCLVGLVPKERFGLLPFVVAVFLCFIPTTPFAARFAVAAVLAAAGFLAPWPPAATGEITNIKLGLDLKGGIHLVLQVITDDALNATVDDAVQATREQAGRKGIVFSGAQRVDTTSFSLEGVGPAQVKDARDLLKDYTRGEWDIREPAEGRFLVKMTDKKVHDVKTDTIKEEIQTLERRVNQLGVAEPVIAEYGASRDQILIQLPGVTDVEQAKHVIGLVAKLSLQLVEDSAPSRESLLQSTQGKVPDDKEVVTGPGENPGQNVFYLVRREAVITGRDLKTARVGVDQNSSPAVNFSLKPAGSEKFKRETGRSVGRRLAIILDGSVASAPNIQQQIVGEGIISGRFSTQEADELSKVLRAGALPAKLKYLQELTVGASLGKDSIRSGVTAAAAGMAFLTIFMLTYYRFSGLNAVVALTANLLILLGAMAYFGATLTLPGIAGIILTIGVGVDTNVLVFERIREEIRNGRTVKAAVANGFERVWITILDTHATALIAAAFLFQFGTGAIKGFAVTLVWGLTANVFASYFVSKFLFEWVLGAKRQVTTLSI